MKFLPCMCGGNAVYVARGYGIDAFECDACDYTTNSFWDGEDFAADQWNTRNNPANPIHDPEYPEYLRLKKKFETK